MRSLIISIVCMALCLSPWFIYAEHSSEELPAQISNIDEVLLPAVMGEEWASVKNDFYALEEFWQSYRRYSGYFVNRELLSEIDSTVARCKYNINAQEAGAASSELAALSQQLAFLYETGKISIRNIL